MVRVEIKVNIEKCTSPLECGVCLKVCAPAVFVARPKRVRKFYETPSSEYSVIPLYLVQCTLCMECVEKCPEGAIEVKYHEPV